MKKNKWMAFSISGFGAIIAFVGSRIFDFGLMHDIMVAFSSAFVSAVIALLVVNIFLERQVKKAAMHSLLAYVNTEIASFHNALLNAAWNAFGKSKWEVLHKEYLNSNGDPSAIREADIATIHQLVSTDRFKDLLRQLTAVLSELMVIATWNLDQDILTRCLQVRISIKKVQANADPEEAEMVSKRRIVECFLDVDYHSQLLRHGLMKMAGIRED